MEIIPSSTTFPYRRYCRNTEWGSMKECRKEGPLKTGFLRKKWTDRIQTDFVPTMAPINWFLASGEHGTWIDKRPNALWRIELKGALFSTISETDLSQELSSHNIVGWNLSNLANRPFFPGARPVLPGAPKRTLFFRGKSLSNRFIKIKKPSGRDKVIPYEVTIGKMA